MHSSVNAIFHMEYTYIPTLFPRKSCYMDINELDYHNAFVSEHKSHP